MGKVGSVMIEIWGFYGSCRIKWQESRPGRRLYSDRVTPSPYGTNSTRYLTMDNVKTRIFLRKRKRWNREYRYGFATGRHDL